MTDKQSPDEYKNLTPDKNNNNSEHKAAHTKKTPNTDHLEFVKIPPRPKKETGQHPGPDPKNSVHEAKISDLEPKNSAPDTKIPDLDANNIGHDDDSANQATPANQTTPSNPEARANKHRYSGDKTIGEVEKNIDELASELSRLLSTDKKFQSKYMNPDDIFASPFGHKEEAPPKKRKPLVFDHIPKTVKDYLDRFVVKQDEAKKVLSIAICDHFNHVKNCLEKSSPCSHYQKQNVIMVGPTGVGKTFLIQCIADLIGVPFVKSDATKFTETGYVGGDVEDLVRQLVAKADGDVELAQYGIVYLDEIDKIAGSSDKMGKDVSGRGVQSNLLKLMESTEVPLKTPWDIQSQLRNFLGQNNKKETINTRHILFIVSGAFVGMDDIVRKRVEGSKFGFERTQRAFSSQDLFHDCATEDFIKFGLESEFIGRLPVRVVCDALNEDDLYDILTTSETSVLKQLIASFKHYGIDINIPKKILKHIAHLAILEKTGARGLMTVLERTFRDFKFELPSFFKGKWTFSLKALEDPEAEIIRLKELGEQSSAIGEESFPK